MKITTIKPSKLLFLRVIFTVELGSHSLVLNYLKIPIIVKYNWFPVPDGTLFYFQLSPSKDSKPTSVPPTRTSYDVGGLEAYTTYKFAIFAKNSLGSSVKSAVVSARTSEASKVLCLKGPSV